MGCLCIVGIDSFIQEITCFPSHTNVAVSYNDTFKRDSTMAAFKFSCYFWFLRETPILKNCCSKLTNKDSICMHVERTILRYGTRSLSIIIVVFHFY